MTIALRRLRRVALLAVAPRSQRKRQARLHDRAG